MTAAAEWTRAVRHALRGATGAQVVDVADTHTTVRLRAAGDDGQTIAVATIQRSPGVARHDARQLTIDDMLARGPKPAADTPPAPPARSPATVADDRGADLGEDGPAAHVTAAGRAFVAERDALRAASRTREPGDDDGDEPPPSAPQPPPQGRRTRATASGPTGDAAPADAPAAWLGDDAAAEAHAAGWSHARHVEASVRRHGPTVSGDAYDRLVRVAAARLEAMAPADAYGTRPTAAGLHRTVSRWAAEGPVTQRRAA